jgi:hypothetical protein
MKRQKDGKPRIRPKMNGTLLREKRIGTEHR